MQFKTLAVSLFATVAVAQTAIDYAQLAVFEAAIATSCASIGQQLSQLSDAFGAFSSSSSGQFLDDLNKQVGDFESTGSDFVKLCYDISNTANSVSYYQADSSTAAGVVKPESSDDSVKSDY